jgi:hypothetical protein
MNYYAQGGLANVAQNIATKGRNGDTQLLHVSPNELHGLQALAKANGTTLTTNPDTGLPEAFNFKRLIPMAAGAALAATGVGAPAAAMMVGGGYGLATGSVKQGIMAGIGAYGGAGLATGLGAAGAATAEGAVAGEAARAAAGQELAKEAAVNAAAEGITLPTNYADLAAQSATPAQVSAQMSTTSNLSNMGRGIGELGTSQGRSAAYAAMPQGTLPATATSLVMQDEKSSGVPALEDDEYTKRLKRYRLSPDYQSSSPAQPNPYYRATYAAAGGVMESFDDETGNDMARGGIASLGGYSDGGRMLKGPGDGMSDSIPGVIGGKQPARLADGEFVVPADVVSHLGNGSTDGGAKKLYAMMDKIRSARTGKKKQAPEINADKYLPVKQASGGIAGYANGGMSRYASGGIAGYAEGGTTYSDGQVAQAIAESMAQGFSLAESLQGATQNYGISQEQADRAAAVANVYQAELGRAPDPAGAAYWANSGLSTIQIAEAMRNSPEAQAASGNTGGVYQDKTFSDAQVASYLAGNNVKTQADISSVQNAFGVSSDQIARAQALIARNDPSIAQADKAYATAIATNPSQEAQNRIDYVTQVYSQQIGRAPDAEGLAYWTSRLAAGDSPATVASEINRSLEGVNFDTQAIESAYNRNLRRTAEQEGFQFWLSNAQANTLTQKQLMDAITKAAEAKEKVERNIQGKTFTDLEVADLVADPFGGRRATTNIYDIPKNAAEQINISYINGIPVQFISPVTERALISKYGEGTFKASMGEDTYSPDRIAATADRAFRAGSMTKTEYDKVMTGLDGINKDIQAGKLDATKAGDSVRQLLNVPKGFKIIDPKYGQQIGEDNDLDKALAEAAKRQDELAKQDPGYYQANDILGQAYLNAGLDFPFMRKDYTENTMMTQADKLTPQNVTKKIDNTMALLGRTGPYQTQYDPINRGTNAEQTSIRDPYSDEGLKLLYGRMMDQYGPQDPGKVNPAIAPTTPYTYKPPVPQRLLDEQKAKADYEAKIAEDRLAYPTSPITQSNFDAAAYLRDNPDVARAGVDPFGHYQEYGKNEPFRVITRLPFTPAPFTPAPLFGPTAQGIPTVAPVVADAAAPAPVSARAGGLMALKHRRAA